MANQCAVTGKKRITGNHVSHAKNHVKRTFLPNIHTKRFKLACGKVIRLKVSAKGLRIIDKLGIDVVYARIQAKGA
jgi:large subunit ribosomal protein L28